jgi:hypothetical protein
MRDIVADHCGHANKSTAAAETIAFHAVDGVVISEITITDSGSAFISMNRYLDSVGGTYANSNVWNLTLTNFYFDGMSDATSMGIRISDKAELVRISDGTVKNTQGTGIGVPTPGASDIKISDVTIENAAMETWEGYHAHGDTDAAGLRISSATDVEISDVAIKKTGNANKANIRSGLEVSESQDVVLSGVTVSESTGTGILVRTESSGITLKDVTSINNSVAYLSSENAVEIQNSQNVKIDGIEAYDNRSPPRQPYGLKLEGVTDRLLKDVSINNYHVNNNKNGGISLACSITTVSCTNIYVTGTVTIPSTQNSIKLYHNLGYAPTAGKFTVTPLGPLGLATSYTVTGITTSQFTIKLNIVAGIDVPFSYKIRLN